MITDLTVRSIEVTEVPEFLLFALSVAAILLVRSVYFSPVSCGIGREPVRISAGLPEAHAPLKLA